MGAITVQVAFRTGRRGVWMIWAGVWTFRCQVCLSVGGRAPTRFESTLLTNPCLYCEHGIGIGMSRAKR